MAPNLTFCDIWDERKVEEGKGFVCAQAPASGWMKEKGREVEEKEGGVGVQAPNRAERSIEIILDHKGWNSRKSRIF